LRRVIKPEEESELVWRYVMGESPADLSVLYGHKRTTIRALMGRKGVLRTPSESALLAVERGKKDRSIKALVALTKRPDVRWHPAKSQKGEDNPRYKKDRNLVKRPRKSYEHADWRRKVFERDDYTCQDCGEKGIKLSAHHIVGWKEDENLRYELSNGKTLCHECHKKTDNYGWRAANMRTQDVSICQ